MSIYTWSHPNLSKQHRICLIMAVHMPFFPVYLWFCSFTSLNYKCGNHWGNGEWGRCVHSLWLANVLKIKGALSHAVFVNGAAICLCVSKSILVHACVCVRMGLSVCEWMCIDWRKQTQSPYMPKSLWFTQIHQPTLGLLPASLPSRVRLAWACTRSLLP